MAGVGVKGPGPDFDVGDLGGNGRQEGNGVPLEVTVVNPDRIEAQFGGLTGIFNGLAHLTPGGKSQSDPADYTLHGSLSPDKRLR